MSHTCISIPPNVIVIFLQVPIVAYIGVKQVSHRGSCNSNDILSTVLHVTVYILQFYAIVIAAA